VIFFSAVGTILQKTDARGGFRHAAQAGHAVCRETETAIVKSITNAAKKRGRFKAKGTRNELLRKINTTRATIEAVAVGSLAPALAAGQENSRPRARPRDTRLTRQVDADLYRAAQRGDVSAVKALLIQGADIESRHDDEVAMQHGHVEGLFKLLAGNIEHICGTALLIASIHGHTEVVKLLLAAGANTEAKLGPGCTALLRASTNGHAEVVEALLEAGAAIEAKDNAGFTALEHACYYGCLAAAETLLAAGANINCTNNAGDFPLYSASYMGHVKLVKALLKAGANIEAKKEDGFNALLVASQEGHSAVVEVLMAAGANIAARTKRHGQSAFDKALDALDAGKRDSEGVIRVLEAWSNVHSLSAERTLALADAGIPPTTIPLATCARFLPPATWSALTVWAAALAVSARACYVAFFSRKWCGDRRRPGATPVPDGCARAPAHPGPSRGLPHSSISGPRHYFRCHICPSLPSLRGSYNARKSCRPRSL